MTIKKKVGISLIIGVMFLLSAFTIPATASSTTTEKIYFHHDPNTSYTVGTVNTGGLIFNSTTLGFTSSGYTWTSSSGASNTYWYLSQLTAGSLSVGGVPQLEVDMFSTAADTWNETIQIYYQTSSAGGITQLSDLSCTNSCFSTTTSQNLYSFSMPSISTTTIPAGDMIAVYLGFTSTITTQVLYTIVDSSSLPSYLTIPLTAPAVTVNSLSLSTSNVQGSGSTSTATLSVSDAFGLYDLASQKITVSIPGTSADPINAAAMTAAASNTPTSYTGTYTYSIDPSSTSYSGFAGTWAAQSTVTDNSGNSYSSSSPVFNYSPGGSCISCTSTSHTSTIIKWNWKLTPLEAIVVFLVVVLIVASAIVVIRH